MHVCLFVWLFFCCLPCLDLCVVCIFCSSAVWVQIGIGLPTRIDGNFTPDRAGCMQDSPRYEKKLTEGVDLSV